MTQDAIDREDRYDDVIYRFGRYGKDVPYDPAFHNAPPKRTDVPYRIMLPKRVQRLLAAGRSASTNPTSLMRARPGMMLMGQAAGIAAALAAQDKVTPTQLDVKKLQRTLLDVGIYLGERARLQQLGLT